MEPRRKIPDSQFSELATFRVSTVLLMLILAALCNIVALLFFIVYLLSIFFSSPNLNRRYLVRTSSEPASVWNLSFKIRSNSRNPYVDPSLYGTKQGTARTLEARGVLDSAPVPFNVTLHAIKTTSVIIDVLPSAASGLRTYLPED